MILKFTKGDFLTNPNYNMRSKFYLKISWSFIFTLFTVLSIFGQKNIIRGIVYDEFGEVLIGATILEKGNPENGTTTDIDGSFQLELGSAKILSLTLEVSYTGYATQEVEVKNTDPLEITMTSSVSAIEEVVVTALGIKRQKRELGYSTESFEGDAIQLSQAPNIVNSLQGRSAGVQVSSANGVDGGTTRITIRGNNNIDSDNQPLIIVDGVPLQNQAGLENIGRGVDWGSAINNINPNDIETYNILKGPTAAAKYGSRGANGVILITTKRGKQQKGIGINYSLQHKIIQPYRYRDVQNVYGAGGPTTLLEPTLPTDANGNYRYPTQDDIYLTDGVFGQSSTSIFGFYGTGVSWGPKMEGQIVQWWDGEMRSFDPQPDNLGLYFSNGNTTTHNLSFSGGGEMGTMRVSLTRTDHKAIVPNSNYNQTTVNIGSTLNISSKVKADVAVTYLNYQRLNSPTLGDDHLNSFSKGMIYSFPRSYKGLEKEINILPDATQNNYGGSFPFLYAGPNIWWNTYNNNTNLDRNKLIGSLSLNYQITNWLSARGRLGLDFSFAQFETRNNPIDALGILNGRYENELAKDRVLNNDFLITATNNGLFESLIDITLSVGGTQWSRSQYGLKARSGEWVNPWLFNFNNYADGQNSQIPREVFYDKKINSIFSFLNLSYENFLFLELSGRNDWSSSLPIENNSYFYPSGSLSFIATEALDLKLPWLNFLKLRGAYAQTATDTNPFQVNFTYRTGSFGNNQTAALPTTVPPIALKPQRANSYEVGTTMGLFDNKINIDFTYYYIRSYDQILDAVLSTSSGAPSGIRINTGELENKGIEAIVSATIFQRKDFFLQTGFNIGRNRNRVTSMGIGAKVKEIANIWGTEGPTISVREGDEFGTIMGFDYQYHENGQPILNEEGTHYLVTSNRIPIGNASPDFIAGWNMKAGYKGFTLSTLIDTKWGGDIYSGSYVSSLQNGQSPLTLLERQGGGLPYTDPAGNNRNVGVVLPGVYADGTENQKVVHYLFKYIPNTGGWGPFLSTPGILENSYVKLREVTLSYHFNEKFNQRTKVFQDLTLSLVGRDLFYIYTSLPDRINPEGANGSGNAQGLEWAAFPGTRSFGVSLNASF